MNFMKLQLNRLALYAKINAPRHVNISDTPANRTEINDNVRIGVYYF